MHCKLVVHANITFHTRVDLREFYDGHSRVNDMYEYNFHLKRWRNTGQSMVTPSARDRHAAVVSGHSFYIFGGFDGFKWRDDMHVLDVGKLGYLSTAKAALTVVFSGLLAGRAVAATPTPLLPPSPHTHDCYLVLWERIPKG